MHGMRTKTLLLLGALMVFSPAISFAAPPRPGTLIETRPYETDDHITASIRQEFARDKLLKRRKINITTEHAIVTLRGTVSSKEEIRQAYAIAKRNPAVDKVRNKLKLGGD